MNKLEFYKKAKTHFTKNPLGMVPNDSCPKALCSFLSQYKNELPGNKVFSISKEIFDAKEKAVAIVAERNMKFFNDYNTAFFPSNASRLKFINERIKRLTR